MMARLVLIAVFLITAIHSYGAEQLQMPEASELVINPDEDLQAQVQELRKNVSDIWIYINELRSAVSGHLTHLRQHQAELESNVHKLEHFHEGGDSETHGSLHGDSHHHSGEQHSHSGEHHSHSDEQHSHGGDHGSDQHSHSGDQHSHSGDQHSHSGDQHSHSGDQHSHSGEHHSHSGEHHSHSGEHHSHSDSHSHTSHDHTAHSHDDSHSHGSDHHHHHDQNHKDSHETEDLQTKQVAPESGTAVEPIVTATTRQEHYHHHNHQDHSHSHSHGAAGRSGSTGSNTLDLMNEHSFHNHGHHELRGHSHHHDDVSRSRNRTVEIPKYSEYAQYDFATCNVQPNRAIPEEQQQNVGGQVILWQKKTGGPLNFHVRLQGFQMGDHHDHHGAHQSQQQQQQVEETIIDEIPQSEVGHKHGFHIHASGDLSNGCQSTGPHYNPKGANHGGPNALVRHVGDLGNIECDAHGITNILFSDDVASLQGPYSVEGKAMVVHSNPDDFGQGGNAESLRTGNAGTRIACCVIQKVDKIPIRYYKAMKTASQYQNF